MIKTVTTPGTFKYTALERRISIRYLQDYRTPDWRESVLLFPSILPYERSFVGEYANLTLHMSPKIGKFIFYFPGFGPNKSLIKSESDFYSRRNEESVRSISPSIFVIAKSFH